MPPKKRPPDPSNADSHDRTAKRRTGSRPPGDEDSNKQGSSIEQKQQPKTSNSSEPNPPPSTSSSHRGPSDIILQLSQDTLKNMKLQDPRILTIPNAVYVTEPNGTTSDGTTHYLYDLICRIFECELSDVKLYKQPDGAFRNENRHGWKAVAHHGKVEAGIYLCKVGKGTISIDPVHMAKGGQGSRPASSAGTRMQTPDRLSTPPPPISHEKQADENALKTVAKSKIGSSKFRDYVVARDKGCIVYRTIPDHCKASHIIPASLVKYKLLTTGPMTLADRTTVVDEYDPSLGILLGQDLDFHFNRFQMSFYVTESNTKVHLFRTEQYWRPTDFLPSAWSVRGKSVTLPSVGRKQTSLLAYHYKHAVIEAWGSYELKRLLAPDFLMADDGEFALLRSLGDVFTPPPSSPAYNFLQDHVRVI